MYFLINNKPGSTFWNQMKYRKIITYLETLRITLVEM